MIKKSLMFLMLTCICISAWATESNPSIKYIQRTMKALEESTAEHPAHVRVLFYGQSIVSQKWTNIVQTYLKEKYPTVRFVFQNNAIGGYTSERLVRTAESDLYPWYPDLLFFHVYGSMDKYEEIVRTVRERTTAEIILWTSHLGAGQNPNTMLETRDSRSNQILTIAKKYNCAVIDLNYKWSKMLVENGWEAKKLLRDGIHLNDDGCERYARFIAEELVRIPGSAGSESSGTITSFKFDDPRVTKNGDGSATIRFKGNRICAVGGNDFSRSATAALKLDGKEPATFTELWAYSRTSTCPKWMPSIFSVRFNVPLLKETWTLSALPDSAKNGRMIHYRVEGSVTGFDGEGVSTEDFTSNSGRVVIPKGSFNTMFDYFKMELPKDYKVTWRSVPLFAEPYRPEEAGKPVVLIQNCSNEEHTLTIVPKGKIDIVSFIVNTPAK